MEGLLLVNKPPGITSHDVVERLRRRLGLQRIGHTGTLDPIAQGLLILLLGAATKRQQEFQSHEKTYEATIEFGTQTDTADAMGRVIRSAPVPALEPARLTPILSSLTGSLVQQPPVYSAVKVHGRPSYRWAREGRPVVLRPRTVQVFEIALQALTDRTITVRLRCSAGTYVRSLAEVIAERLGTVGHVASLTRWRVGAWSLEEAVSFAWLSEAPLSDLTQQIQPVETSHARLHRS